MNTACQCPADESPSGSPTPERLELVVDFALQVALVELTSGGTAVHEAARDAVIESAARLAARRRDLASRDATETLEEWVAREAAAAPPLSERQLHMLRTAFSQRGLIRPPETREEAEARERHERWQRGLRSDGSDPVAMSGGEPPVPTS